MSSTQQPGSEEYVLTGLKNVDHLQCDENLEELDLDDPPHLQPNSSSIEIEEEDDLEDYVGDENDVDFMLRLINAVKESPALYDPMISKKNPGAKDDAWRRIRNQLIWNGAGSIESVWNSLIDQYADDKDSLEDTIRQSLEWIDRYIEYKDTSPQPDLEKDSYLNDTVQEDVMISGCRTIASHTGAGYVVVQPQRSRHQPMPSQPQTSTAQHISQPPNRAYANHHVPNGNVGQPAVRRLVISSHQPNLQPYKRTHQQQLQTVKKEDSNGVTTMMVDMTTYYDNGNGQKLYRLMQVPQNGQRQYHIQNRQTNHIEYDLPPEPLIEGAAEQQQPPRKKMTIPQMITTTSTSSTSTIQSNNRVEDNRIVAGGVPIADDEIIDDGIQESTIVIDPDGHLHEESPLLNSSPDVMISGQSTRHQQSMISEQKMGGLVSAQIPSTSAAQVPHVQHHHHHHQMQHQQSQPQQQQQQGHISRSGRPEEVVDDPVETATAEILEQQNQYDADLQFQQLISSHLSRLSDDDKAIMKYHMQRILLDARFGDGTAKHLIPEVEILEGEEVVHTEHIQPVNQSSNQQQPQQEKRFTN